MPLLTKFAMAFADEICCLKILIAFADLNVFADLIALAQFAITFANNTFVFCDIDKTCNLI